MNIQVPSFRISTSANNSTVRFCQSSIILQKPIALFDSTPQAEKPSICMLRFYYIAKTFEELRDEGVQEAENGNIGRALSLLSHAASINDKDYKTFEMIAQVAL